MFTGKQIPLKKKNKNYTFVMKKKTHIEKRLVA